MLAALQVDDQGNVVDFLQDPDGSKVGVLGWGSPPGGGGGGGGGGGVIAVWSAGLGTRAPVWMLCTDLAAR
jgi:hypothetical protein